jgi:serine/threonine protein kinase
MHEDVYEILDTFSPDHDRGLVVKVCKGGFGRVYITCKNPSPTLFEQLVESRFSGPGSDFIDLSAERALDAYKTLHDQTVSKAMLDNFYREAQTWLRLENCPNIVRAIEVVRSNATGRPFVRMPYFELSFRNVMGLNPEGLGLLDAIYIILEVLEGLKHATPRGFWAHLDLKPENLLCNDLRKIHPDIDSTRFRPRITDFGLSRLWDVRERFAHGLTPAYAAPEQYGSVREAQLGPWSDIFALGAMLFEFATGRHPSGYALNDATSLAGPGDSWEGWTFDGDRRDIRDYIGNCPRGLSELLQTCLSVSYKVRPQTYAEMQDRLYEALEQAVPSETSKAYREFIGSAASMAETLGVPTNQVTPDDTMRRIENLWKIDPSRAEAEATDILRVARDSRMREKMAGDDLRLAAMCAAFLAERVKESPNAFPLRQEALEIILDLSSTGKDSIAILVPSHLRDRTAYTLASHALDLVLAESRQHHDGLVYEQDVERNLLLSARLAPYLCRHVASRYHTINDLACKLHWLLRAIECKSDEAEFWFMLAFWAKQGEALYEIAPQFAAQLAAGLRDPCQHGRTVPWKTPHEHRELLHQWIGKAKQLAPIGWNEPKLFVLDI